MPPAEWDTDKSLANLKKTEDQKVFGSGMDNKRTAAFMLYRIVHPMNEKKKKSILFLLWFVPRTQLYCVVVYFHLVCLCVCLLTR